MSIRLPKTLEWQRRLFEQIDEAIAAGEQIFMCNVGRQTGKTTGIGIWSLAWQPRGALFGGAIAICGPSSKHTDEIKAQAKRWLRDHIIGPSTANGWRLDTNGVLDFWSLGAGAVAPLRGRTYDAVIVDECAFVPDLLEVLEANIGPTLSTTGGPILLFSTPDGVENDHHTLWRRTPAKARFSGPSSLNPAIRASYLKRRRASMPELKYLQEHEAAFVDLAGAAIKRSEVQVGRMPDLSEMLAVSIGFDFALSTSLKADWSAAAICCCDREHRYWVAKVERWRASWPKTKERALSIIDRFKPDVVVVESVAFGELSVHELMDCGVPLKVIKPSKATGKEQRFGVFHERYVRGLIIHNEDLGSEFTNEFFAFPLGKNDDQVDAVCYGLTGLMRDVRQALDTEEVSSGAQWGGGHLLPHEKKKKPRVMYDFWGNAHECRDPDDDTPIPLPAFTEQFVGDELIVTAADGHELMRIERGRSHLYFGQKIAGKLPWQQPKAKT
jgi:phage terminase large subunit-like protein